MEQTSYRLVTEKYDQQQPGLPIVTLWDNVQQGVGLCYFSPTIRLITCDSSPAVDLTATKTGQTPSWRLPETCWRSECEWEQRESLRMSAICRPPAVGSPLYSPDTWHTQLLSFIEWQTGAAVFTCVVRPVQRCLERSRGSSSADLINVYVEGLFNEDYWARLFQCGPSPLLVIRGFYFGSVNWYVISYSYYFEYFSELLLAVTFWSLVCCKKEKKTINF